MNEVRELMKDQIIVQMAAEAVLAGEHIGMHMSAAMQDDFAGVAAAAYEAYRARGGGLDVSAGSPARAIINVVILMERMADVLDELDPNWKDEA